MYDPVKLIDGKAIAQQVREGIAAEVARLEKVTGKVPGLAAVLVGEDPASQVYVRNKHLACEKAGMRSHAVRLPADTSQEQLLGTVRALNRDEAIHGILVQLPLPKGLDEDAVIETVDPEKDVDGFHPYNVGRLSMGRPTFRSATPYGILQLLERSHIPLEGKEAVVVGRSNIVGKPVAQLLLAQNATVTVAHSRTINLPGVIRRADILVAAIGKPQRITGAMIKPGAVVIDVGINRLADGRLVGDVDFESAYPIVSRITPVPGGVGPMTIAMLLANTLSAFRRTQGLPE